MLLATCIRLTDNLPNLSLITTHLLRSNGEIAGRQDIRADLSILRADLSILRADLSISKRFHFLGILGRVFLKFSVGKVRKSLVLWIAGFEPTTQKTQDLSTTPFFKVFVGD